MQTSLAQKSLINIVLHLASLFLKIGKESVVNSCTFLRML